MSRFREVWFVLLFSVSTLSLSAQTFPTGFSRQTVTTGMSRPSGIAFAPDGRIFVTQQSGQLRIIKNGTLLTTPFITLTVDDVGERGLIGLAFDPEFETNQFIYLYYTVPGSPPHNRLSRFTADGDVVVAGSETILLELDPLSTATNHNGGALVFGKDGKLYIGVGDNATAAFAQSLTTYHGKILRINKDGGIPDDNPFVAASGHAKRIWALGVRNPFSLAVNSVDGKIFANDVGLSAWEEINDITVGGLNFGWPEDEGVSTNPDFVNPVYTYPHGSGDGVGCAITGGMFFTPAITNYPSEFYGRYFFQDYCERWINVINPADEEVIASSFATSISNLSLGLITGPDGNIYYLSRAGSLFRIVYNNASPPFITHQPESIERMEGTAASFEVGAIGTTPFTYQWKKNGEDIAGATGSSVSMEAVAVTDAGEYSVTITNEAGTVDSDTVMLTVIPVLGTRGEIDDNRPVLFPNPAKGKAVLQIYSDRNEQASIIIYDQLSRVNKEVLFTLVPGLNQLELPIDNLTKGIYIVAIKKSERKFLKLLVDN